ncbi:MAG: non-ribosomal peptide synthetase [bacterium]
MNTNNGPELIYDKEKTIQELFEQQVARTPRQIALVFEDQEITYAELNRRANQLGRYLRLSGIGMGDIIAIMLNRSVDMIVALLGVLKSGAAYLPIDPLYPSERVKYMLSNCNSALLITKYESHEGELKEENILSINNEKIYRETSNNLEIINKSYDLAYIIFTSGSTGKPKGVMIEHRAVHNFCVGIAHLIDFNLSKRILGLTTISFDIFVLETFIPLITGTRIYLANEEQQMDSQLLSEFIIGHEINMVQITPSRLQMLLAHPKSREALSFVKEIMVGGEAFPSQLLHTLQEYPFLRIFNMYGPTETTVWSSVKELTHSQEVTIGKPLANTQMLILDENHSPLPVNEIGELCISGDGLARGYMDDESKTAKKFIAHPLIQGQRIYKTGDLAQKLENGEIKIVGRNDTQVKVRGYRIELKEIEEGLMSHAAIYNAAVLAFDDKFGYKYLVGYYTSDQEIPVSSIKSYLADFLPAYMIPSIIVYLKSFPLTPNGKLNRKALPKPETTSYDDLVVPESDIQKKILSLWMSILPTKHIGVHDNFFDIGGNSYLLVLMSTRLNELFPNKVEVADIFAHPTISKLANFIEKNNNEVYLKGNIEFQSLNFPSTYFQEGDEDDNSIYSFTIDGDMFTHIDFLSSHYSVPVELVFISLFLFLLSQITGETSLNIPLLKKGRTINSLAMNFAGIDDLSEILHQIKEKEDMATHDSGYDIETIKSFINNGEKKMGSVLIINGESDSDGLINIFDMIVNIYQDSEKINFQLEFNPATFKKSKMEELINKYLDFINLVACGVETA